MQKNRAKVMVEIESAAVPVLMEAGWQVSGLAAFYAPHRTGGGARSIHPELVMVNGHPEVHVSWDRRRFWMGFAELGTEHQRATPFLRRAAQEFH